MPTLTSSTSADAVRPPGLDAARSERLLQRIRGEFFEMPGLTLTLPQAARLWCVTMPQARAALSVLVGDGFLARDARGVYRRHGGCARCS
jgi:hypothetical protein